MAEGLTQTDFARVAGTSQQAVSRACRAGHLERTADGRLDPADPQNAQWAAMHLNGYSSQVRRLDSYRWRDREPPGSPRWASCCGAGTTSRSTRTLADRLRDELAADDGRTILAAVLAGIPREFERLRAEMAELRAFAQRAGVQSTGSAAGAQPARGLPL
jgi:hypothetical protein